MRGDAAHPCQAVCSCHPEGTQEALSFAGTFVCSALCGGHRVAGRVPSPALGTECVSWGLGVPKEDSVRCGVQGEGGRGAGVALWGSPAQQGQRLPRLMSYLVWSQDGRL